MRNNSSELRRAAAVSVLLAVLLAAGCGGASTTESLDEDTVPTTIVQETTTSTSAPTPALGATVEDGVTYLVPDGWTRELTPTGGNSYQLTYRDPFGTSLIEASFSRCGGCIDQGMQISTEPNRIPYPEGQVPKGAATTSVTPYETRWTTVDPPRTGVTVVNDSVERSVSIAVLATPELSTIVGPIIDSVEFLPEPEPTTTSSAPSSVAALGFEPVPFRPVTSTQDEVDMASILHIADVGNAAFDAASWCYTLNVTGWDPAAGDVDVFVDYQAGDAGCEGDSLSSFYAVRGSAIVHEAVLCGDCDPGVGSSGSPSWSTVFQALRGRPSIRCTLSRTAAAWYIGSSTTTTLQ